MKIAIINGPNLNLLGVREPGIYGTESFEVFFEKLVAKFHSIEFELQNQLKNYNVEGELINEIQRLGFSYDGIIINPGGYTHTSVAIGDAIASIKTPVIEVHISNVFGREDFRKISHVSAKSVGVISGLGMKGYELAVGYFVK